MDQQVIVLILFPNAQSQPPAAEDIVVVRLCIHSQLAAHLHRHTRPSLLLRACRKRRGDLPRTVPTTILHSAGRCVRRIKYAFSLTAILSRQHKRFWANKTTLNSHLDPHQHPLERQNRHPQKTRPRRNLLADNLHNRLLHYAHLQAPKRPTPRPNLALLLERTRTRNW